MCGNAVAERLVALLLALAAGGATDWPSSRHDPHNTAATRTFATSRAVPRSWTFEVTRHVWGYQQGMAVWSSPAIGTVDGRAVVAAGSYDSNVYLFDACSGEEIWRFATGAGVYAAPALWRDREGMRVFAASSDRLIYALDAATGGRLWSTAVQDWRPTLGGARLSAPCVGRVHGRPAVFVGHWVWDKSLAHNLQQGGVTAIDARTGRRLWTTALLDNRVGDPLYAETDAGPRVFVSSADGNLRALDAGSGAVLWHHREIEPIMGAPARLHDETAALDVVLTGSHFGKLRALDTRSGEQVWEYKTGNWITGAPAVFYDRGIPRVVFGSYDQRIHCIDARDGTRRWTHPTAGPVYSSPAVVPAGEDGEDEPVVLAASWDHSLYALSGRDGRLLWNVYTGPPIWDWVSQADSTWSSPAAAWVNDRWMVYFGSYSGVFYGIPINQAAQVGPSRPWSNLRFWLTMALSLLATTALAIWLTRRRRSARRTERGDD